MQKFHRIYALIGLGLLVGCADGKSTLPVGRSISVEVGEYSGAEDPHWTLTPVEASILQSKLDALPTTTGTLNIPNTSRSWAIYLSYSSGPDPVTWIVYNNQVGHSQVTIGAFKSDPKYTIMNYIAQTAKYHMTLPQSNSNYIDQQIYAFLEQSIPSSPGN